MKKLLLCVSVMALLLTGCGKVPKLADGKEAVVSLKDGGISVDDLYSEMKNKYALGVLIDMMDEKILSVEYPATEEEKVYVDNQVEQLRMYHTYYYSTQFETFESFIQAQYGVTTEDELKDIIELDYKRKQAVEDYAKSLVTESEINKYYEEKTIGNIEASHILITAEVAEGATDDEKKAAEDAALQKARDIITKLNNGEDFATLAKEHSKDGSASNGGQLNPFNRGDMVQEFEDAALALNIGEYSKEPVKSQFGYHIILKRGQQPKPALESVKDEIVETLSEEKLEKDDTLSYKALIELREEKGMTIEDKDLKSQYENYVYNTTNK